MNLRHSIFSVVLLAALSTLQVGSAAEDFNLTFRQAAKLIDPYLVLTDRSAAEARTDQGRAQIAQAIAMLTRVTAADPSHWQSYWFIGKAHQALRNHPDAFNAFRRSLNLRPPYPDVAREFVIEAICVGATTEAVVAAREVAEANPSNSGLLANLGLALLADGKASQARATVEKALAMAPEDRITRALLEESIQVQAGQAPSKYCPP